MTCCANCDAPLTIMKYSAAKEIVKRNGGRRGDWMLELDADKLCMVCKDCKVIYKQAMAVITCDDIEIFEPNDEQIAKGVKEALNHKAYGA